MTEKNPDNTVRRRIQDWIRYEIQKLRDVLPTDAAFAKRSGLTKTQVSNIKNRKTVAVGLDMLVRLHTRLGLSLDTVVDYDPPPVESLRRGQASTHDRAAELGWRVIEGGQLRGRSPPTRK